MPYSGRDSGYFRQTYSTLEKTRTNLVMLLMTRKGERVMMPTYGCDIWEILFEPNIESYTDDLVEDSIKDAAAIWMPEIEITDVVVERDSTDHVLDVNVSFLLVNASEMSDTVTITP